MSCDYYKVVRDYEPVILSSELAIEVGDIVVDVKEEKDGWLYGRNLNSEKVGKFPSECVATLTAPDSPYLTPIDGDKRENKKLGTPPEKPKHFPLPSLPTDSTKKPAVPAKPKPYVKPPHSKMPAKGEKDKTHSKGSGVKKDEKKDRTDGEKPKVKARDKIIDKKDIGSPMNIQTNPMSELPPQAAAAESYEPIPEKEKIKEEDTEEKNGDTIYEIPAQVVNLLAEKLESEQQVKPSPRVEKKKRNIFGKREKGKKKTKKETKAEKSEKKADKVMESHVEEPEEKLQEKAESTPMAMMASYESIRLSKSTESLKDAVQTLKRVQKKLVTNERSPWLRKIIGFSVGIFLGVFIFLMMYVLLECHLVISLVLGIMLGFVISIILSCFEVSHFKCMITLLFPSIFTAGGKIAVFVLIIFFIVSGSICNTVHNVQIVADGINCLEKGGLNESLTITHQADILNEKFHSEVNVLQNLSGMMKSHMNGIKNRAKSLAEPLSTPSNVCSSPLYNAWKLCGSSLHTVYQECKEIYSRSPREWQKALKKCKMLNNSKICPETKLTLAKLCRSSEKEDDPSVKKIVMDVEDVVSRLGALLDRWVELFGAESSKPDNCKTFCHYMSMLLPLLILIIFYETYKYHKLYLSRNDYDNFYLTEPFKIIDDTRKSSGGNSILPLKKIELLKYITPTGLQLSTIEKKKICKFLKIYFIFVSFFLIFILLDYYLYAMFHTDREQHSSVNGTEHNNYTRSNFCVPNVREPNIMKTIAVVSLLGALLIMILSQAHVLRLRRAAASSCYPKRECERIRYLYYKVVDDRKVFFKRLMRKIRNTAEEGEAKSKLEVTSVLCHQSRALGKILGFCRINLHRCMVCDELENRHFKMCENCKAIYCEECYYDIENQCLGCLKRESKVMEDVMSHASEDELNDGNHEV